MLVYRITFPALVPGPTLIATRELTASVTAVDGSAATTVTAFPAEQPSVDLSYNEGDQVTMSLVDISQANVRSDPSPIVAFTATDLLKPGVPGALAASPVHDKPAPAKEKEAHKAGGNHPAKRKRAAGKGA